MNKITINDGVKVSKDENGNITAANNNGDTFPVADPEEVLQLFNPVVQQVELLQNGQSIVIDYTVSGDLSEPS